MWARLASGQAARYAVEGDPNVAAQARSDLAQGEALASEVDDPEQYAEFTQYAERIRHRLETRELITAEEYQARKEAGTL